MAGYGSTQVNVGAMVDPGAGIKQTLMGIANIQSAKAEREAEAKIREQALVRQDARDALAQKNFEANAAESARRNGILDERYNKKEAEIARQKQIAADYANGYDRNAAVKARLANNPDLVSSINERRETGANTIAKNLITSLGGLDSSGRFNADNRLHAWDDEIEPVVVLESDLSNVNAGTIKDLHEKGLLSKEDYKKFNDDVLKLNNEITDYVNSNLPLYQQATTASSYKALLAAGANEETAASMAKNLNLGYDSKDKLTKQALDLQKLENARYKDEANLMYKVWNAKGGKKDYSSRGPKNGFKNEQDVISYIKSFNGKDEYFSDLNDDAVNKLVSFWKAATDPKVGVDRNVAMLALGDYVEEAPIWGKNVKGDIEGFVEFAKGISDLNSGKSKNVDDLVAKFTPKRAVFNDPIEQNRQAFLGGINLRNPKRSQLVPNTYGPDVVPKGTKKGLTTGILTPEVKAEEGVPVSDYGTKKAVLGNEDVPGSLAWQVNNSNRANRRNAIPEPSILAKVGGAMTAGSAMAGAIPGMVGYAGGGALDILNKWSTGNESNFRDKFGNATSFFQLDADDRGTLAEKYLKNVTEPLSTLPPTLIPPGIRSAILAPKAIRQSIAKNKMRYSTPLYDSVTTDTIPNTVTRASSPGKSLAARDMLRKADKVKKTRSEYLKVGAEKVRSEKILKDWESKKVELEAQALKGNKIAERALRFHMRKHPTNPVKLSSKDIENIKMYKAWHAEKSK